MQDAKQKEVKAQAALDGLVKARDQVNAPALQLSPELKRSVHSAVANRYRRIGAVMVLGQAYVLLFLMLLAFKFLLGRSQRALQTLAAAKDKEAQASDMRRQMTEARLQTLQAQVKPHYLIVVPLVAAFALIQGTARATTAANARPASPGYAGGCTAQTPAGAAALDQG